MGLSAGAQEGCSRPENHSPRERQRPGAWDGQAGTGPVLPTTHCPMQLRSAHLDPGALDTGQHERALHLKGPVGRAENLRGWRGEPWRVGLQDKDPHLGVSVWGWGDLW